VLVRHLLLCFRALPLSVVSRCAAITGSGPSRCVRSDQHNIVSPFVLDIRPAVDFQWLARGARGNHLGADAGRWRFFSWARMRCYHDRLGDLCFRADRFSAFRSLATVSSGFSCRSAVCHRIGEGIPRYHRIEGLILRLDEDIGVYPRVNRLILRVYAILCRNVILCAREDSGR
jgi:hypothetical protein